MLKRKQYHTKRERKKDQLAGFIAFFGLMVFAFAFRYFTWELSYSISRSDLDDIYKTQIKPTIEVVGGLMPYIVFFGGIVWSLYFRPEFGVGFVGGIAFCIVAPIPLGIISLAGCLVAMAIAFPFTAISNDLGGYVFGISCVIVFLCMAYLLLRWGVPKIRIWLDDPEDKIHLISQGHISDDWHHIPENEPLSASKEWSAAPDITWENDVPEGKGGNDAA